MKKTPTNDTTELASDDTTEFAPDANEQITQLAADVMNMSRNRLTVDLRYMANPISMLTLTPEPIAAPMTDGKSIFYDPVWVLKSYSEEKQIPVRTYLHLVLHCVYMHFYISRAVNTMLWDLACDIAVEATICDLELPSVTTTATMALRKEINKFRKKVPHMTAEVLYGHLMDFPPTMEEYLRLRDLFSTDSHLLWYVSGSGSGDSGSETGENDKNDDGNGSGGSSSRLQGTERAGQTADANERKPVMATGTTYAGLGALMAGSSAESSEMDDTMRNMDSLRDDWLRAAEQMKIDVEAFRSESSRQQGTEAGNGLLENLDYAARERYDYAAFLRQFGVMGEAMKINDEEFDYSFYCFGLKTYGNVPLVEPLEYKDVKKLREFVIAIDTSASTSGDLVRMFLRKTYNILMQRENFHTKVNIRIIQCDAKIQEDVKITSKDEFEHYMNNMHVRGLGGTDFRPVFKHVEKLQKESELTHLKGLIYFTDGYGTFPKSQPPYKTAFVFVNDGFEQPEVPVWAIKLVLEPEEINEIRE